MAYIGKSPSTGVRNRFTYTATAGQATFSGADDNSRTLTYNDSYFVEVHLNGVLLDGSDYTATSGTSIVLDEAAAVDDILEVVVYDTFSVFSGEFSANVTVGGTLTANGNVDVTGDLTVDTDTLHVDSTNNNVGIGTSSPNSYTGFTTLTLNNATNGAEIDFEKNGTVQGSIFTPASLDDFTVTAAHASGDLVFQSGGYTERMRIDSSGRVAIGTSSPQVVNRGIHLHDDAYPEIMLTDSASGTTASDGCLFSWNHPNQYMWNREDGPLIFATNNAERLRISKIGSLEGIITNNGTYTNGTASSANMVVASGGQFLRSVSAGKYKTDVEDMEASYAEALYGLRSVYYRSNLAVDNPDHSHWGFIAEEVAAIDPRLVHYKTVEVTYDDNGAPVETELDTPVAEGVQYERFVPLLLKLIKDQKDRIETLETQNADFETRIAALEAN